ncbi:hypothetical protein [Bradyrhizobium macuxiense]|nr:hypothetical protein [Bradyrhizobium macuxiense]
MDESFRKERAGMVRDLAAKADPFVKRRLLDLANRYDSADRPDATAATPDNLEITRSSIVANER